MVLNQIRTARDIARKPAMSKEAIRELKTCLPCFVTSQHSTSSTLEK